MKSFLLNAVLFVIVLLISLELLFRTLIPASNVAYKALDKQYGILLHDTTGERDGQYTTGRLLMDRVHWRINNWGWRSDKEYLPPSPSRKPVIALIGDSYIAGFQVNSRDHFGSVLEDKLGHRYDVYNFGSGGTPASQAVYTARYARDHFDPDIYIFLVRDPTWKNSIANYDRDPKVRQLRWDNGRFTETLPSFTSGALLRWRKRSALIRYLVYNADLDLTGGVTNAVHHVNLPSDAPPPKDYLDAYPLIRPAMDHLIGQLRADLPGKKILFLSNVYVENIYDNRPQQSQGTLECLREVCNRYQIPVLDLAPAFASDWNAHRIPLTFEIDYHWNARGHSVVADTLADFLIGNHWTDEKRADALTTALTDRSHEDSH